MIMLVANKISQNYKLAKWLNFTHSVYRYLCTCYEKPHREQIKDGPQKFLAEISKA